MSRALSFKVSKIIKLEDSLRESNDKKEEGKISSTRHDIMFGKDIVLVPTTTVSATEGIGVPNCEIPLLPVTSIEDVRVTPETYVTKILRTVDTGDNVIAANNSDRGFISFPINPEDVISQKVKFSDYNRATVEGNQIFLYRVGATELNDKTPSINSESVLSWGILTDKLFIPVMGNIHKNQRNIRVRTYEITKNEDGAYVGDIGSEDNPKMAQIKLNISAGKACTGSVPFVVTDEPPKTTNIYGWNTDLVSPMNRTDSVIKSSDPIALFYLNATMGEIVSSPIETLRIIFNNDAGLVVNFPGENGKKGSIITSQDLFLVNLSNSCLANRVNHSILYKWGDMNLFPSEETGRSSDMVEGIYTPRLGKLDVIGDMDMLDFVRTILIGNTYTFCANYTLKNPINVYNFIFRKVLETGILDEDTNFITGEGGTFETHQGGLILKIEYIFTVLDLALRVFMDAYSNLYNADLPEKPWGDKNINARALDNDPPMERIGKVLEVMPANSRNLLDLANKIVNAITPEIIQDSINEFNKALIFLV